MLFEVKTGPDALAPSFIFDWMLFRRRREQLQFALPRHCLSRLECNHAGVDTVPLFAPGIAVVELLFHGDELLLWWSVDLYGFDLRRLPFDMQSVVGGRIDDA